MDEAVLTDSLTLVGVGEAPPLTESAPVITFETEMAYARGQRRALLSAIEPEVVDQIPISTLVNLAYDVPSEPQTALAKEFLTIISHPDEVEAMVRLGKGGAQCHQFLTEWKEQGLKWLSDEHQPEFEYQASSAANFDEFDYFYQSMVSPPEFIAGDTPFVPAVAMENGAATITEMRPPAFTPENTTAHIIGNATTLLLADSTVDREALVESLDEALRAREKWWTMGGRSDMDIVTRTILETVRSADPALCAQLATRMYLRKIQQDFLVLQARLHLSGNPLEQSLNQGVFMAATGEMLDWTALTDPKATKSELTSWVSAPHMPRLVFDRIFNHPKLNTGTIERGEDANFSYYGQPVIFPGGDEGTTELKELSFGLFIGRDVRNQLTQLYQLDETDFSSGSPVRLRSFESASTLSIRDPALMTADKEKIAKFYRLYPEVLAKVTEYLPELYLSRVLNFSGLYQLWQYLDRKPVTAWDSELTLIRNYGTAGLFATIAGEYDQANVELLMRVYKEKIDNPLEVSMIQNILNRYSQAVYQAHTVAFSLSKNEKGQADITETLLLRSKSLLMASIKYIDSHELKSEEWRMLQSAFDTENIFLNMLADPTGTKARSWKINRPLVEEFYQLHDPADPESRIFLQSAFDLFYTVYSKKQQSAEYFPEMDRLRSQFYARYVEIQTDMQRVTPDTRMDHSRLTANIRHSLESGDLPKIATKERPCRILFVGIGEGRAEEPLIDFLRQHTQGYEFQGLDVYEPEHKIPGVNYALGSVESIGSQFPAQFQRIYILASPLMDELKLAGWPAIVGSITGALTPGGEVIIDQALPVGKHSYEAAVSAYHSSHPDEPEGIIYRSWPMPGGGSIGKHFFAPGTEFMLALADQFGLTPVNISSDPRWLSRELAAIHADDSILSGDKQLDLDGSPFYQSHSLSLPESPEYLHNRWNRVTYRLRKTRSASPLQIFLGSSRPR